MRVPVSAGDQRILDMPWHQVNTRQLIYCAASNKAGPGSHVQQAEQAVDRGGDELQPQPKHSHRWSKSNTEACCSAISQCDLLDRKGIHERHDRRIEERQSIIRNRKTH